MEAVYTSHFSRFPDDVEIISTEYELCLAEQRVAILDIATHKCNVVNRELLPVALYKVDSNVLYSALCDWLIRRALPISRANYEAIIKSAGLSSNSDIITVITKFNALSLVDNYWLRPLNSVKRYADVNLYQNHFADLLPVSLLGEKPITITGTTPDINQRGCMSKCYSREDDQLYIYKYSKYSEKIYAEVFASKIAQMCRFNTVAYTTATKKDKLCSRCLVGTSVDTSWVTASEISLAGINPKELALRLSPQEFYQMLFFDYVTGNIDRHNENWSFTMNNSGVFLSLTPLYDFDNCFIADDEDFSKITLRPMIRDAKIALQNLSDSDTLLDSLDNFLQSVVLSGEDCYKPFAMYSLQRIQKLINQ